MNTALPAFSYKHFARLAVIATFYQLCSLHVHSQCAGNLLLNASFESPVVPVTNGNNIMGPGNTWGGWSCTNGGLNILRVQGSGYGSGANIAANGNQYVDVANSDGYISQQFTLSQDGPIFFSGSFSNRESGWSSYINWTGKVEILDNTSTIIAVSTTRNFITTDNNEAWYTLTGSTSIMPAGTYTYRAYAGNSGHFDDASVCALGATVLPIKLKSFTATLKNGQVKAEWIVSEEKNVKGYETQFSTDGINFKTIGFVPAANSGQYNQVHTSPVAGLNYYRLKTQDIDGKTYYSNICKVNFDLGSSFTIYPNPASTYFQISIKDEMIKKAGSLTIMTLSGLAVQQKNFAKLNRTESIDITHLNAGTYFIRITTENGTIHKTLQVTK